MASSVGYSGFPAYGQILLRLAFWNLKRVIVTPAVYRSFIRLKPGFRYRHWAGFSDNTHPFGLAVTCVFIKQSELPCHCDQRLSKLAPLLPKVQG